MDTKTSPNVHDAINRDTRRTPATFAAVSRAGNSTIYLLSPATQHVPQPSHGTIDAISFPAATGPWYHDDIFHGLRYRLLRDQTIFVHGRPLGHCFYSNDTDIALGLATDGFGPFKKRNQQCWPLILINYNLPPSIRNHCEHIMPQRYPQPQRSA